MATPWSVLEQRGRVVAEEASARVAAGGTADRAWLASAACWLSEDSPPWAEVAGTRPTTRQYRLIVSSLHLEAWLICWPPDGRLALHDHGGASGALRVVDGALTEEFVPGGRPPAQRRRLPAGTGISFDGAYLHDVANLGSDLATSIHVYTAAERPMAHYRITADGLAVSLDPPAGGPHHLHPAGSGR